MKKPIAAALTAALALTAILPGIGVSHPHPEGRPQWEAHRFSDTREIGGVTGQDIRIATNAPINGQDGHWMYGYPGKKFRPGQTVTPAQMTKTIRRVFPSLTRGQFASFIVGGYARIRHIELTPNRGRGDPPSVLITEFLPTACGG